MGMALVIGGGDGVTWWQSRDSFPYVRGFVVIVLAWIVSPICAFIAVSIVFLLLRWLVLRSKHSFVLSFWVRFTISHPFCYTATLASYSSCLSWWVL